MVEVSVGTISARGQVAIPTDIRDKMRLKEGEKVLFLLEGDSLLVKRVSSLSWQDITKPLREAKKKIGKADVVGLIHGLRKARA